ncbi:MAG TPA: TPM domain-containing protein [Ktedonobacterales bacterium]|nr:TPM domain-containing protein [Ktedonobacterales bacterium]
MERLLMGRCRGHTPWALVLLLPLVLALMAGISSALPARAAASASVASDGCAGPVAGQHIYDCAHLLTPAEIANLEQQAAAVAAAGAPTVVYLQVRDASAQQALQDAIDLMGRWNVESSPGARDGFVMFFDLQSGNHRHGQVALYAGEKHYKNGNLPQSELDRIRTDVMTPLLKNEQTAEGIAAGLQMVAHDLRYGPPPPPAYRTVSATLGRLPFNILAVLFAGVVGLLFVRLARSAPMGGDVGPQSLAVPGELPPAIAGALIKGRVDDAQIEATILDFARRGLLVFEPTGTSTVRIRLLSDGKDLTGYEQKIWTGLADRADDQRTLSNTDLTGLRQEWSWPKTLLRRELVARGWLDPEGAAARRRPLFMAGGLAMVGVIVAVLLIILSREGWAAIGLVVFLAVGVVAFIRAAAVSETTVEGEIAAAPWRAYRDTVADHSYEPNLDADLPYIVALGLLSRLTPRLKAASERGYAPSWFRSPGIQAGAQTQPAGHPVGYYPMTGGFFPYWIVFHSSMAPAPSTSGGWGGSASGGYSGGGAAGGGGGSAGGF